MSIIDYIDNINFKKDTKIAFAATFLIGLICHGYWYLNLNNIHDDAILSFRDVGFTISDGKAGRFIGNISWLISHCTAIPLIFGIVTLFCYFVISLMVCRLFEINNTFIIIMVSGLLVTSPTAICADFYLWSMSNNAIAFAFSVLAVVVFFEWKYGWVATIILTYLVSGMYTAYIDVTAALFLAVEIKKILFGKESRLIKKIFLEHVKILIAGLMGVVAELFTCLFLISRSDGQLGRLESALTLGAKASDEMVSNTNSLVLLDICSRIKYALLFVFDFFSPSSYRGFFQGIKLVYYSFVIFMCISFIFIIFIVLIRKLYQQIGSFLLLILDFLLLPLMMNAIALVSDCDHLLMTASFITPILLCISIFNEITKESVIRQQLVKNIYEVIVIAYCVITIFEGCIVANVGYTAIQNDYRAGLSRLTRLVDHIESIEGYVPGETEVILVGNVPKYDIRSTGGYGVLYGLTGFDNETAFTFYGSMVALIKYHLAYDINIINCTTGVDNTLEDCMRILEEKGFDDLELKEATIRSLSHFPSTTYSHYWVEYPKVLVYSIGEIE